MADLGEIVRGEAGRYLNARFTTPAQRKAMRAIAGCRTEVMGSASMTCEECGDEYRVFRSCRNRSCPLCQSEARASWLEARKAEILPVSYLHLVFTAPAEFNDVALYCPEEFYDALMRASGQAVMDVGRSELHAQLGCLAQLHTWSQQLAQHLHTHSAVPCGGFSADGSRWVSFEPGDLPVKALAGRFRMLLCDAIRAAARDGKLDALPESVELDQILLAVAGREWNVYAQPPFGGPEQLLEYLSRYTHRVAITNDRIVSYQNHQVTFTWRDYRDGKVKPCTLDAIEFLRRFLLHVPPRGFVRIRSYGFLANRNRKHNVERARQLIAANVETPSRAEPFKPLRLCPACYDARRAGRTPQVAPRPDVKSQLPLTLRPPPIQPVAA